MNRIRLALVPAATTLAALSLAPASPVVAKPARPKVTVSVPASLVEGERYQITVKLGRAKAAKRVLLQHLTTDYFGNGEWETVKAKKVRGKKKHVFKAVAGEADSERYRARVEYAEGKPAMSKPAATTVWHWGSMMEFTAYSRTNGIASNEYNQFRMNGVEYRGGWSTYGSYVNWDLRFTPGRNCKAFRGVVGLTDDSADGSSGALQLVADDVPVYSSPVLSPGTSSAFQVDLALPYRLFIQAQRTSPAEQRAYPAIGNPELLCTGLG